MRNQFIVILFSISATFVACTNPSHTDDQDKNMDNKEANTQEAQSDIPKAIKDAFAKKYPKANDVKWEVDANGYYEADFKMDGEKYRTDFNKSGKWVETENSIKFDDLPEAVQKVIENDYDKDNIAEIESVDSNAKGKFYDVEFKQKGKNKDIEINEQGKVIN